MNRNDIERTLDRYYDAFNAMDKEGVLAVFTADANFIDLTMSRDMHGLNELSSFIDETWRRSPFFRLEPEDILIDGNNAAVRLFMSGSPGEVGLGEAERSDRWRIPSTSFFRFRDDRICWKADCWNMLSIPRQVGWPKFLLNQIGSSLFK